MCRVGVLRRSCGMLVGRVEEVRKGKQREGKQSRMDVSYRESLSKVSLKVSLPVKISEFPRSHHLQRTRRTRHCKEQKEVEKKSKEVEKKSKEVEKS